MEELNFSFTHGSLPAPKCNVLVGVVGSGNLEVFIERIPMPQGCEIKVNTSATGFNKIWQAVLTDFFEHHPHTNMKITINDGGGTPSVVRLRLEQAIEMAMEDPT